VTDGAVAAFIESVISTRRRSEHVVLFAFIGRILGKALYEALRSILVCPFLLSFLRGDYNYLHMLSDLSTVDPQLYNNLMFLKTYDGDAGSTLSFTVTVELEEPEDPIDTEWANIDVTILTNSDTLNWWPRVLRGRPRPRTVRGPYQRIVGSD
jgi:hypothetical protein